MIQTAQLLLLDFTTNLAVRYERGAHHKPACKGVASLGKEHPVMALGHIEGLRLLESYRLKGVLA